LLIKCYFTARRIRIYAPQDGVYGVYNYIAANLRGMKKTELNLDVLPVFGKFEEI